MHSKSEHPGIHVNFMGFFPEFIISGRKGTIEVPFS
jgi:hypothetical protein